MLPYLPVLLDDGVEPGWCTVEGSFVSADVTGFTSLSERLAQAGRIGAEVLSTSMDRFFTSLIDALTPFGGDVLFFGGDALFVAFLGEDHARRAVDGAAAMLHALRLLGPLDTPLGPVRVAMKVGVATGPVDVIVGDGPQSPLFLAGPTVSRTVLLESRAEPGEIHVDALTAQSVDESERRAVDYDDWVVTTRRVRRQPPGPPVCAVEPPSAMPRAGAAERHLPAALRARLLAGDAPKAHRQVVVAFVRIRDLDRLTPAARADVLRQASIDIGEACETLGVCWVETDVADDGATIVIAGGVHQQRDDDELRVVAAARRIVDGGLGGWVSIGINRGTAFVGEIGHARRRTYAVTGLTTITAARLAKAAEIGTVLASVDVIDRLRERYDNGPARELAVKGRREPVRAATIGGLSGERSWATPWALVGRRAELGVLGDAVASFRAGTGAVIDVVGPPGMGKTRLLQAFLASSPTPRIVVGGELAASMVPFGVLAPALRQAVGATSPDDIRTLADALGSLAPLVGPVLGAALPATDASLAIEATAVPAARAELVVRMLRRPAGLLIVDDAHWLDPATVELLGAIVDPLAEDGWLTVLTRRPEMSPPAPHAVQLVLEPLVASEVGRLATAASNERPLSDAQLDAIVERAGGNPLFVSQLARSSADTGDIGVPESAERVVGARIDLVPPDLRTLLRRASVFGRRVDLCVLQEVTGDPDVKARETWAPLEEFVRWSPAHVEFNHDLFRLVAYEGLSFAERSELHRRAADLLEERSDTPAAVLAEHSRFAGRHEDVIRWATQAADEAAAGAAFVDEARLRRLAADSAKPAGVRADERIRLYTALAHSYETLGEVDAAEAAYRRALAAAAPAERTTVRTRLAWLAFRNDDLAKARRRVAAALRHLSIEGDEGARLRVELVVLRSAIRGAAGDRARSDADARWAAGEAQRLGDDELRGEALMQLAFNADISDDEDAEALHATAVSLLDGAGRRRDVAILQLNRGVTHMVRGRWPAALALFELAADGFRRCGFVLGSLSTDANRGGLLLEQGRPVAARELFEDVERRAYAAGNPRKALFASASVNRARAWTGETEPAIAGLAECIQAYRDAGLAAEADGFGAYLVEALVLAGRFGEAIEQAAVVLPRLSAWSSEEVIVLSTRRLVAVARYLTGDREALAELGEVLAEARAAGWGIEVARCLQALELCSPSVEAAWAAEREERCRELGVAWLPPVTFAGV